MPIQMHYPLDGLQKRGSASSRGEEANMGKISRKDGKGKRNQINLVMALGAFAYNILRFIGQTGLISLWTGETFGQT